MSTKFTLGALAGISAVALAIPLLAQGSFAASPSSAAISAPTLATAQVSQQAAEQAALAAHSGTLSEATRNDSHFGGYKVEITGSDGNEYDVIVDASTGQITDSWIDGQGGPRGGHGGMKPAGADTQASSI